MIKGFNQFLNTGFSLLTGNPSQAASKIGTANMLTCEKCAKAFCYICNKPVEGAGHYGSKAPCREHSHHYQDF